MKGWVNLCNRICVLDGRLFELFLLGIETWWVIFWLFNSAYADATPAFTAFSTLPALVWAGVFAVIVGLRAYGIGAGSVRFRYGASACSTAIWSVVAFNFAAAVPMASATGVYTVVAICSAILCTHLLSQPWGGQD